MPLTPTVSLSLRCPTTGTILGMESAQAIRVEHIAVASSSHVLILEINGKYYELAPDVASTLRRDVQAATINMNY